MLPGRVVKLRLDPLTQLEWTRTPIEDLLVDGGLPGVITEQKTENREVDLESYVSIFVDEEIRKEALVRNVPAFSRFLEFAALDSGRISNFAEISRQTGVAHTTIASHYQVLTDCLVAERFDPITTSKSRKRLTKSSKYLIFDMGVRRLIAAEGRKLLPDRMGELFEQWVGLELRRMARALGQRQTEVHFWRDPSGPEVDWVLKTDTEWIPIEVKWTDKPTKSHATHLKTFIDEYPAHAQRGVVICRTERRSKLTDRIEAWPYQELHRLLQRG
jgi:predicted AAA+ superfamily ATPase